MMPDKKTAEDKALLIRAQSGDAAATELFLAAYVPMLGTLARRFFCTSLSVQDLCQAGYIGLMLALKRYDAKQDVRFITYAMPWALGEMRKAMHRACDSTGAHHRSQSIAKQLRILSAALGREPRIDELAKACGLSAAEIVCTLESSAVPQSLDASCGEQGRTLLETLVGGEQIDDQRLDIRMALARLNEQERKLIILRYHREHTQKETAKIMGISQAQASRIERRALKNLRAQLT